MQLNVWQQNSSSRNIFLPQRNTIYDEYCYSITLYTYIHVESSDVPHIHALNCSYVMLLATTSP